LTFCNIGNPQEFHQKPITFFRQVTSYLLNPELMKLSGINKDAAERAQRYLDAIISPGSYTESLGIRMVRESIAKYIAGKDGVAPPSIDQLFLTEGASQGVHLAIQSMITNPHDAVMIPVPQYPLYSASITMHNGTICPYYLNEERGWQLDEEELEHSISNAKKEGKHVKMMVAISPGNPTGSIFNEQTIKKIIEFSVRNKMVLLADEVYRENVYKEGAKFTSFRRVLETMPR
jgi:aspartate/methionine/tyrosine aminotransferase